jgi:hypothetical protein
MNIIIRIFPRDRISNFTTDTIEIDSKNPNALEIYKVVTSITRETHKLARGTKFIKDDDRLSSGETINAFPIA